MPGDLQFSINHSLYIAYKEVFLNFCEEYPNSVIFLTVLIIKYYIFKLLSINIKPQRSSGNLIQSFKVLGRKHLDAVIVLNILSSSRMSSSVVLVSLTLPHIGSLFLAAFPWWRYLPLPW